LVIYGVLILASSVQRKAKIHRDNSKSAKLQDGQNVPVRVAINSENIMLMDFARKFCDIDRIFIISFRSCYGQQRKARKEPSLTPAENPNKSRAQEIADKHDLLKEFDRTLKYVFVFVFVSYFKFQTNPR
jgi:hypothetical protein